MKFQYLIALALWAPAIAAAQSPEHPKDAVALAARQDGQHDFDFEFGAWKVHISRRLKPLTGSTEWVEYDGTSVVEEVWNGKANLGQLEVDGSAGHLEGLSLRLYNPETRLWYISWSNSRDGALGPPMIGGFVNGRGEFYNQETLNDKPIMVRFIFSEVGKTHFRLEQAFSGDGGKNWETNWVAVFTKTN